MELGQRLRQSDNAQQRTRGHVHVAVVRVSVSLDLSFLYVFGNDVIMELGGDDGVEGLGVRDEGSHHVSIDRLVVSVLDVWSSEVLVDASNVLGQSDVLVLVLAIKQEED